MARYSITSGKADPASASRRPGRRRSLAGRAAGFFVVALASTSAGAEDADSNILQARSSVAEMADESLDMLKGQVALEGVDGWAVFAEQHLPAVEGAGLGLAEDFYGETWYLQAEPVDCLVEQQRHVLVFRDADLFQAFRQGEVQGATLERIRQSSRGALEAFRFTPQEQPELEPMDLGGCRFALHKDLQRALVAEPSRTEGLVEDGDVDIDDN